MTTNSLPECVWLLRHAETATPALFHGAESDVGLSELGEKQAIAVGEWFRELHPTAVVSSTMQRAVRTAAPIAQACEVEHHLEFLLHERRVGEMCGKPFSLQQGPWAETLRQWTSGNTSYTTSGAESFDDLTQRLLPAWNQVVAAHPRGRVVIVAHGIVCKVLLLNLLEGGGAGRWAELGRVANVSVTHLVPHSSTGWKAERLLEIPEPVATLSAGEPTGIGVVSMKSEA
jgi:2,3-bisphosphoglycerate-dependent phosphoglycerate mutase